MAYFSIEKRERADGTPRYRCTVGVRQNGKYLFRESKTFARQAQAKSWGARMVQEIETNGIPDARSSKTIGDLIRDYLEHPNIKQKVGRDKLDVLTRLQKFAISNVPLSSIVSNTFIEHCRFRSASGASPATVSHDLAYMGSVLSAAKPLFDIDVNLDSLSVARSALSSMGITGQSKRRSRRPSAEEFDRLYDGMRDRAKRSYKGIPYDDIFMFSILSCMRVGEVCAIRWDDINEEQKAVLVRDRKDPRKKEGNHMMVPLLGEAWEIVQRQPKSDDRIFPYPPKGITLVYRDVRNELGIEDLRYHDLRREGASRLFEAGFSIEEVAQVTGHRTLNVLWQVYTELYPKSLHEKFDALQKKPL
ncbi:tyrosine-type recombinase/integrase [Hafnia paralvei]|uniref:Site-specific integrase n=1 Tax=Hafnia paralvei TaxID=546367 RepID=A0A4Q9ETZ8_9GAMM|nr:site-specific integrase [Hafnia paralvei]TBM28253.1 site-specific integrase [Hafnia paralvei]